MELLDQYIFQLFDRLEGYLRGDARFFIYDAQALAAIFMLLYFGVKAFGIMSGDQKWEIMPLLRPFGISLVIIFWMDFVEVIEFPFDVLEGKTKALYNTSNKDIDLLLQKKSKIITDFAQKIAETSNDVESASEADTESPGLLGGVIDGINDQIKSLYLVVMAKFRHLLEEIIHFIALMFFQICTYIVRFLQIFFKHILIVLGPIAFAISILNGFKDNYLNWISRFISVALYSTIAQLVLITALSIIKYGLEYEIQLYDHLLKDESAFILYVTSGGTSSTTFIVSLVIGGLAMLTVPVISTWIVNTSGVGQAVGKMAKGGVSLGKGAAGMVK